MRLSTGSLIIETCAGNGRPGYAGDGGPATCASLNEPKGICLDREGHLFIADSENHLVRRVDRVTGLITTVAGVSPTSSGGPLGAESASSGFGVEEDDPFADSGADKNKAYSQVTDLSGTVRYVTGGAAPTARCSGDGGPASRASLNFPGAVAVDAAGNLYIADTMNQRVRKVDAATGVISTLAGTGQPRFTGDGGPAAAAALNEPTALAVSGERLYIADQSNNRVRMVDLISGIISTAAGNGTPSYNGDGIPATEAGLAGPSGLAVGSDGTLYVADTFNGRIRAVAPVTGMITTVVGDGGSYRFQGTDEPSSVSLSRPTGVAVTAEGDILITDSDSHLIRRYDRRARAITRLAGTGAAQFGGDGGDALAGSLSYPFGVAVDPRGRILIADTFNHRIRVLTTGTEG